MASAVPDLPSHRALLQLAGTKLYCLVTEECVCVCKQIAQVLNESEVARN